MTNSSTKVKVLVSGPYSPFSGYGRDLIGLTNSLERAGVDVYIKPTHLDPPMPQNIANLLTKEHKAPFDVFINHWDPNQLKVPNNVKRASAFTIAQTMWERDSLRDLPEKDSLEDRLSDFDLVLPYDMNTLGGLAPYITGDTKLEILQGGYETLGLQYVERDWNGPLRFIMVGALNERKQPYLVYDVFRELKEEGCIPDAELILKTNIPGLPKVMETFCPGLTIISDTWTIDQVNDLYKSAHVILAPSRGEGKNLPCLEMLTTGGVAIATNWGGHTGWLNDQYSYPLDYELKSINERLYGDSCRDARASKQHLKELILHVYNNRSEAKRKGQIASQVIPNMMTWDHVVSKMFRIIGNTNKIGSVIYNKFLLNQPEESS